MKPVDKSNALETLEQTLREVRHAQSSGANWYTRGASGLYQQVAMHVRRGFEAIAILREHMGEQGQPAHSHLSRAVPSEPSTTREAAEEEDLDAWECDACDGTGSYTVYRAVTHQLGTDELPFTEVCEVCGGGGYCGPDAARAELRRALP